VGVDDSERQTFVLGPVVRLESSGWVGARQVSPTFLCGGRRAAAEYSVLMESRGLIEFRYGDGAVVTGDYARFATGYLTKGDQLEYDGATWLMYDREDRGGVTVHLFSPEASSTAPEGLRARKRRR
jgi:hypothetical protein